MRKERIEWIDISKGIGILLVILTHTGGVELIAPYVYMFHMPLFFYLSGRVFSYNESFWIFAQKRFWRIVIPYVTYGFIFILFNTMLSHFDIIDEYDFWGNVAGLFTQKRFTPLWYLCAVFLLNFTLFGLIKLTNNDYKRMNFVVCISLIIGLLYCRLIGYPLLFNIDIIPTSMPFFYVGYLVKMNYKDIRNKIDNLISNKELLHGTAFFVTGLLIGTIGKVISGTTLEMYANRFACEPLTYLSAFTCIFGITTLSKAFHNKLLKYIGENSIIYFSLHQQFSFVACGVILKQFNILTGELSKTELFLRGCCYFTFTLILLTIVCELLKKTKHIKTLFAIE